MEAKIYGPLELPSGRKIKFRAPAGKDRLDVIRMLRVTQDNLLGAGLLIDQYLKAKVVVEIDGQKVVEDYRYLFDSWPLEDVDFYSAVFNELFGGSQETQEKAREVARFLRDSLTSTALPQ